MLPHLPCENDKTTDESFEIRGFDALLKKRAKMQSLLMKQFWVRWKQEYVTSLREFHQMTGPTRGINNNTTAFSSTLY